MAWVNTITRASAVGKLPVSALQIQLSLVPKSAAEMCDSTAWSVLAPHLTAVFRSGSELCWPAACASSPPVSAGLPYPATHRLRQLGSSLRTCLHLKQGKAARIGINMNHFLKLDHILCMWIYGVPEWNDLRGSCRSGKFRWKTVRDHDDTLWSSSWWFFSEWPHSPHRVSHTGL